MTVDGQDPEVSIREEQRVLGVSPLKMEMARLRRSGYWMHRGGGGVDQWRREVAGKQVKRRLMDVMEEGMKLVREKTRQRIVEIDGGRLID